MSFKPLTLHEGKGLNPVLKKAVRCELEKLGMKEECIRAYLDGADSARDAFVDDVRSAFQGLKADMFDFYHEIGKATIWCASNDEVADLCEAHALKLVDKWFPVFSQSLSEDAKINDGCSQQVTSAPSSEAKSSVSHHVSMGAATVSVATILEIIDLMASIDDNNQVWGHDTNLGDIDVLVDKIQNILSLSQPSGVEAPSVASEVSQQRKRVDGEKTLDFFEEKHGVPAGELSSVSVGEVDVKHAVRKGNFRRIDGHKIQLYRCMDPCRSFLRPLVYGGLGIPDFIKPIDIHRYKPNGDHLRLDPEESKNPMWCITR